MFKRLLEKYCIDLAKQYPVLTITGPRQSGKTTLSKICFPEKPYVNLERPDQRALAIHDPTGFLGQFPEGAILDEIQRVPDLPSYIQVIVDERQINGMYILTGSQQFEISNTITQSLAGRTALIKLLPLSVPEIMAFQDLNDPRQLMIHGAYPGLYKNHLDPNLFFMNYVETYLERDLKQLSQIDNLLLFERFIQIIAGRVGQLLNYNSLANDIGVSQPTVRKWISLLQASYIIFLLPPYYENIGKRLIKTPKLYFYDTGLACYLLGIQNKTQLGRHPLFGNLFENLMVSELIKQRFNHVKRSNLFFYRDRSGNEVDVVIENALHLIPIEIKSAQTFHPDFQQSIALFAKLFEKKMKESFVVYSGKESHAFRNTHVLPWIDFLKTIENQIAY